MIRDAIWCINFGRSFMVNPDDRVIEVVCTEDKLMVDLADGASIFVPLL